MNDVRLCNDTCSRPGRKLAAMLAGAHQFLASPHSILAAELLAVSIECGFSVD